MAGKASEKIARPTQLIIDKHSPGPNVQYDSGREEYYFDQFRRGVSLLNGVDEVVACRKHATKANPYACARYVLYTSPG